MDFMNKKVKMYLSFFQVGSESFKQLIRIIYEDIIDGDVCIKHQRAKR